jgi:phage shock protein C
MRKGMRHRYHRSRRYRSVGKRFANSRFSGIFHGALYRSRRGILFGVCRGIAEYFDFSVFWVRFATLALFFFTGFWPTAVIYFIAAFLMKPEPVIPIDNEDEQEFYDSYVHSREMAAERIKRRYENLERRIQRLEHTVTEPEFNWEDRLNADP